jgi:hypothetical protein
VSPSLAVLLFAVAVLVDFLWVFYTLAITKHQAFRAASFGVMIYASSAFGTFTFVHRPLYMVPLLVGSFIGTFLSIRLKTARASA